MKSVATTRRPRLNAANTPRVLQGPSRFEVEYLRQMKEELETFLRSRNFPTIQKFDIAFEGNGYEGHLSVSA